MRVICIDAEQTKGTLTEGAIYEVTEEGYFFIDLVYYLSGLESPYLQERFVPVSDIDETELVTEEFNEKYCVPV